MDLAIASYEAALRSRLPLAHFNLGKALADRFKEVATRRCAKALLHRRPSARYLSQAESLPAVITCQRADIESFLAESIEYLSASK
jgi:hypothetical protein